MMVKVLVNRSLRVSVLASAILVSFTLVTTRAEEKRPVKVEDILSMKSVSDLERKHSRTPELENSRRVCHWNRGFRPRVGLPVFESGR